MPRLYHLAFLGFLFALGACSGGRGESLRCRAATECPSGSMCSPLGVCMESVSVAASARATAQGAPVVVSGMAGDGRPCEQANCSDLPLGSRVIFRAPHAEGYRFKGWTGSPECMGSEPELVIPSLQSTNTECVAQYVQRVRVRAADASARDAVRARSDADYASCTATDCEVDRGSPVELSAAQQSDARFLRWTGAGCESEQPAFVVMPSEADLVCSAEYVRRFAVSASSPELPIGPTVESAGSTAVCELGVCVVDERDAVRVTAPSAPGYRFVGWDGSSACTGAMPLLELSNVAASEHCVARYVARRRARAVAAGAPVLPIIGAASEDAAASCAEGGCEVDVGGVVTLIAPTVPGYRLSGWTGAGCEGALGSSVRVENLQEDVLCTANYVQGISVAGSLLGAPGEVTASSSSPAAQCAAGRCVLDAGQGAVLTAPSLTDHRFLGWEGDPGCAGTELVLTLTEITSSRTCTARYAPRYRVSAFSSQGGSVTASAAASARCEGASCTVDGGATVTLQAQAADGYRFAGWTGGQACASAMPTLQVANVAANVQCTARFIGRLTVSAASEPAAAGSVRVSSSASAASCADQRCTVDPGSAVTLVATAAAGFRFAGWSGCSTATSAALSLDPVLASTTCTARFEAERFTARGNVTPPGAGVVSALSDAEQALCMGPSCNVVTGSEVTLRATANVGFTFAGWRGCGEESAQTLTRTVVGELQCTAAFTGITLEVSASVAPADAGDVLVSAAGASCLGARCSSVAFGSPAELVASPRSGFVFVGWSGCSTASTPSIALAAVTSNTQCTARFERPPPATHTVVGDVTPAGAGSVTVSSEEDDASCMGARCTVTAGSDVLLRAAASPGFTFRAWRGCGESSEPTLTRTDVSASATCTATFSPITLVVQSRVEPVDAGDVVALAPAASCMGGRCSAVPWSSDVQLTATARAGFQFVGWSECSAATTPSTSLSAVTTDLSCLARFEVRPPNRFTIAGEVTPPGSGTVSASATAGNAECVGARCAIDAGGSVTLRATPAAGFLFSGWRNCGGSLEPTLTRSDVSANLTCIATFGAVPIEVNARVAPANAGQVEAAPSAASCMSSATGLRCTNIPFGSSLSLTATPQPGFLFVGWSECSAATTPSIALEGLSASSSCLARFEVRPPDRFTVSGDVAPANGGTVSASSPAPDAECNGARCTVNAGGSVTLSASVSPGFTFSGWRGCSDSLEPTLVRSNVVAATTCTATFTPILVELGALVVPEAAGDLSATAPGATCTSTPTGARCTAIPFGGSAELTAAPRSGFLFAGWSGCATATTPSLSLTGLTASTSCTARFEARPPDRFTIAGDVSPAAAGSVRASSPATDAVCEAARCTVNAGASVTLTAQPNPGFAFAGWSGCSESSDAALTRSAVSANATCTALFTAVELGVTARISPAGAGDIGATAPGASCMGTPTGARCTSVPFRGSVQLTAAPRSGFLFVGWSECSTATTPTIALAELTVNASCVATFAPRPPDRFTVGADVTPGSGGTVAASSPAADAECTGARCTVNAGASVTLVASPNTGFTFVGWRGCAESTTATLTRANVQANATCTAAFGPILLEVQSAVTPAQAGDVSATSAGASCLGGRCTNVAFGGSVQLVATPRAGFLFGGWSGCSSSTLPTITLAGLTSSAACTATFTPRPPVRFTVTGVVAPATAGTVIASSAATSAECAGSRCIVDAGTSVSLTARPAQGFALTGWDCGDSKAALLVLPDVQANLSCTANFARVGHTITVAVGAGGTVSSTFATGLVCDSDPGPNLRCTVEPGATIAVRASPGPDVDTPVWGGDCAPDSPGSTVSTLGNIQRDFACTLNFERRNFRINFSATGGGTIAGRVGNLACSPTRGFCEVPPGEAVVFTHGADTITRRFNGWEGACVGVARLTSWIESVQKDGECVATYVQPVRRAVTTRVLQAGMGTVTQSSTSPFPLCFGNECVYDVGAVVTLRAIAASSMRFVRWQDCGVDNENSSTTTLTVPSTSVTCTAVFNFDIR